MCSWELTLEVKQFISRVLVTLSSPRRALLPPSPRWSASLAASTSPPQIWTTLTWMRWIRAWGALWRDWPPPSPAITSLPLLCLSLHPHPSCTLPYPTTPLLPLERPHSGALLLHPLLENLPLARLPRTTRGAGLTLILSLTLTLTLTLTLSPTLTLSTTLILTLPNLLAHLPPTTLLHLSRLGLRPRPSLLRGLLRRHLLLRRPHRLPLRPHPHNTRRIESDPSAGTASIITITSNTLPVLQITGASGSQAATSREEEFTRPTPVKCLTPPVRRLEVLTWEMTCLEFAFPFLIMIQGYLISPLFLLDPSRFRTQHHRKLLHDQRIYIESQRLNLLYGLQDSILFNA